MSRWTARRRGSVAVPVLVLDLAVALDLALAPRGPRHAVPALRPLALGPVRPWEDVAGTCAVVVDVWLRPIFPAYTLVHASTSDPGTPS